MSAIEKYNAAFKEAFSIENDKMPGLHYQDVPEWDSVGHMTLIAELEDAFDVSFKTDDIIDFSSYEKGKEILGKYGVNF